MIDKIFLTIITAILTVIFGCAFFNDREKKKERQEYLKHLDEMDHRHPVQLFSANYRGWIDYSQKLGPAIGSWERDKTIARQTLKEAIRKLGGDLGVSVKEESKTCSEGNYYYSIFRFVCEAAKQ